MKRLVIGMLTLAAFVFSMQGAEPARHPVEGVWKSMRAIPALVNGTVRFDIVNKSASFTWQGRGQLVYSIEAVDVDTNFGMTRYTLSLFGPTGAMDIAVLVASDTTIYIGQTPRSGIAIWGAYTRQN